MAKEKHQKMEAERLQKKNYEQNEVQTMIERGKKQDYQPGGNTKFLELQHWMMENYLLWCKK